MTEMHPSAQPAGYAVELYFDPAGERPLRRLIDRLPAHGIQSRRPTAARPHVSLAVFDQVDVEQLSETLGEFARECRPLCLHLGSIGVFAGGEGVVFLAPVVTVELLALHGALHRLASVVAGARREHYLPGRWVPHCTVAEGLAPGDIGATVELALDGGVLGQISIQETGLVQIRPYRVITVFRVGEPASREPPNSLTGAPNRPDVRG